LPHTGAAVRLLTTDDALLVAVRRGAIVDRRGEFTPWATAADGRDAPVWNDDSVEVFLGGTAGGSVLHLGVSASGASYDARQPADRGDEDVSWNGQWRHAVVADREGFSAELAVPWDELATCGVRRASLAINVLVNQSDTRGDAGKYLGGEGRNWLLRNPGGEALCRLGPDGRGRCANLVPVGWGVPAEVPERHYTVRMHVAELDDAAPGQRVFDVRLQGVDRWRGIDIAREVGQRQALVKTVTRVPARDAMTLEFVSQTPAAQRDTAPLVCAIEISEETTPPTPP
jgi:hypothetical protein